MSRQQSEWDSFIEPMDEESTNFDNNQHSQSLTRSSSSWHETSCVSDDFSYSQLLKALSDVPLTTSEVSLDGATKMDEGETSGGKKKLEETKVGSIHFHTQDLPGAPDSKKKENGKRPKRHRCPETHNLSEKRRREKIRGKMKELQDLLPNSYQANRAAMLDEAIGYLKSLKHQVQVMSLGGSGTSTPQYNMPMDEHRNTHMGHVPHFPQPMPTLPKMDFGSLFRTGSLPAAPPMIPIPPLPNFPSLGQQPFPTSEMQINPLAAPTHPQPNIQTPFPSSGQGDFISETQFFNHNQGMPTTSQG